jgi:imidazolonepropionase-like amidohydrolase
LSTVLSAQGATEWKIIHAGTLLADAREAARTGQSIIVRNNVIVQILDGYVSAADANVPSGARVIDLRNHFVMAGLIDSHTHILSQQEPNRR